LPVLGAIMRAFFWNVVTVVGLGLILSAVGVLAYQCILWLGDGYWTNFQFRLVWKFLGLTEEPLSAHGIEELRTWMLDLPLAAGVFLWGLATLWAGLIASERAEADKARLKRRAEYERRRKAW
jgi:hypothetical protein